MTKTKLVSALNELGVSPRMETFPDRVKMQKLVYLTETFGVRLGFNYSWYLHGPYSPDLTRTLYQIVQDPQTTPTPLTTGDHEAIEKLREFLGPDIDSLDTLELLVSIDFLRRYTRNASKHEVTKIIHEDKPYFNDREIEYCWQKSVELDKLAQR